MRVKRDETLTKMFDRKMWKLSCKQEMVEELDQQHYALVFIETGHWHRCISFSSGKRFPQRLAMVEELMKQQHYALVVASFASFEGSLLLSATCDNSYLSNPTNQLQESTGIIRYAPA